ncbi:hypothetical protein ACFX1X_004400 [Malus domestica]
MSVLMSTTLKVFGKNPNTALYLLRRIQTEIQAQRAQYPLLQNAKGTVALPLRIRRVTERGVEFAEAEIGKSCRGYVTLEAAGHSCTSDSVDSATNSSAIGIAGPSTTKMTIARRRRSDDDAPPPPP